MDKIRIELDVEDQAEGYSFELENTGHATILSEARTRARLDDAHLFERDKDAPIGSEIDSKKALSAILHRCRNVRVTVRFEHDSKHHDFPPSATVFRVLHWAIGKQGFNLDDTAKAKANLMLPGTSDPLPKDAMIGRYVKSGQCSLTVDLTLKDFTNG